MAKLHMMRFILEVAPPRIVSVTTRRVTKMLDTIAEEDREVGIFDTSSSFGSRHHHCIISSNLTSSLARPLADYVMVFSFAILASKNM